LALRDLTSELASAEPVPQHHVLASQCFRSELAAVAVEWAAVATTLALRELTSELTSAEPVPLRHDSRLVTSFSSWFVAAVAVGRHHRRSLFDVLPTVLTTAASALKVQIRCGTATVPEPSATTMLPLESESDP